MKDGSKIVEYRVKDGVEYTVNKQGNLFISPLIKREPEEKINVDHLEQIDFDCRTCKYYRYSKPWHLCTHEEIIEKASTNKLSVDSRGQLGMKCIISGDLLHEKKVKTDQK